MRRRRYTGERCDECDAGYEMMANGVCTRLPRTRCHHIGTSVVEVDNTCTCKTGCEGELCDRCRAGFFDLARLNPQGCLQCWCSGVANQCDSSRLNRDNVRNYPRTLYYQSEVYEVNTSKLNFLGSFKSIF